MAATLRLVLVRALVPALLAAAIVAGALSADGRADRIFAHGPAVITVVPAKHSRGVMATTGGWAYCQQLRALARNTGHTLVCGRYEKDGYTGPGLRSKRRLDWGDSDYLASLASTIADVHARVGGELVLLGVSYSGFGVATLASHRPELRPDRLVVIDSYLDLPARRAAAPPGSAIAREIDEVTGGSQESLRRRSTDVRGLAALVRAGTTLLVVWSTSAEEARRFRGATCNARASAGTLAQLAAVLGRPVAAWVTKAQHGHDLWDSGRRIMAGRPPGMRVVFRPGGGIPSGSVCP
jgi:hypothetical protein